MLPNLHFYCLIVLLFFTYFSQAQPATYGHTCPINSTTNHYPCQTYVLYRAKPPDYGDLASIGDLFNVSRLTISKPSNISNPSSSLSPNQPLFIPISCGCHSVQNQTLKSISFANITYTIKLGDSFYFVSTDHFGNLTTYQAAMVVNPTLDVYNLTIGSDVYFPILCKCPNNTQLRNNNVSYLVSYVFQPIDTLGTVASFFGVTKQSIVDINGDKPQVFETIFVPISRLIELNQPAGVPTNNQTSNSTQTNQTNVTKSDHKSAVVGLSVGLGISVLLLVLVSGFLIFRDFEHRKKMKGRDFEVINGGEQSVGLDGRRKFLKGGLEQNLLLADVSDTLDKYKVYEIEELKKATDGFDDKCLIEGSVYKGCIDGKFFAIKKMKWNAYEELKILQKVNHGNLVRLEGFSIEPEDGSCFLVYEYVDNDSLYSWLHENKGTLNWTARLRISIDVANGLQYIHEHTQPQVVHKDIKSNNILLDTNMRAKIANFGLARSGCNAITMHIVGTQGYIAPEYMIDGVVSPKMDVFSFGVVLLELLSGREAIDEEGNVLWVSAQEIWEGTNEEEKANKLMGWIDPLLQKESCSAEGLINMMTVAVACVSRDPSKRPGIVDVVYALCKSDALFYDISGSEFSSSIVSAR